MEMLTFIYYSFLFFVLSFIGFFFFYFFYTSFWNKDYKPDARYYFIAIEFSEFACSFLTLFRILSYFFYLGFLYIYDTFFLYINSYLLEHCNTVRARFFFFSERWLNNYKDVFFLFKEGRVSFINFFICSFVFSFVLAWFLFFMRFYFLLISLVFNFFYSFCWMSRFFYNLNLQLNFSEDSKKNVSRNFHYYFYYFFFYVCMGFQVFFKIFRDFFGF